MPPQVSVFKLSIFPPSSMPGEIKLDDSVSISLEKTFLVVCRYKERANPLTAMGGVEVGNLGGVSLLLA